MPGGCDSGCDSGCDRDGVTCQAAPISEELSSPKLKLSLHPIGGFCAVGDELPLPPLPPTQLRTPVDGSNGLNAPIGHTVHCVAAEPRATFLRVAVFDDEQEVAYETAVLGRLRRGYRVLQLRGPLGTRIEYVVQRQAAEAEAAAALQSETPLSAADAQGMIFGGGGPGQS